jgi:hypothetical protein
MQSPFEPYLSEVENRLKTLSKDEKATEITEIRSHLEAASEDYLTQGMSAEKADALAIEEFGTPRLVAKQLIKIIWRARLKNFPHTFLGTTLFCLPIPILVSYLCVFSYNIFSPYLLHQEMIKNDVVNQQYISEIITFFFWNILFLITLIGYFVGRFLPIHAWRSTIIAYATLFFLLGLELTNARTPDGRFLVSTVRDAGTTVSLFTLFIILWLMLPLKRYIRSLIAFVPVALFYLCFLCCNQTLDIKKFDIENTSDPVKSFIWVLFNPPILCLCLIITGYIIVPTSLGVGLGRLHTNAVTRRRRMRAV